MKPIVVPESQAFWQACGEGRLTLQVCRTCDARQFLPRRLCVRCHSAHLELRALEGSLRLRASFPIEGNPRFDHSGLVEHSDGTRFFSWLDPGCALRAGAELAPRFTSLDGFVLYFMTEAR